MEEHFDFDQFKQLINDGYGMYEEGKQVLKRIDDEFISKELTDLKSLRMFLNRTYTTEISQGSKPIYHDTKKNFQLLKTDEKEILPLWASTLPSIQLKVVDDGISMIRS